MKYLFIYILAFCLFAPSLALAEVAIVEFDTNDHSVNALEATLKFPDAVRIGEIYTGGSALLIWVKEPELNAETNSISFIGLTPGGFQGRGQLFKIYGEFNPNDLSNIVFADFEALSNDGKGTPVRVSLRIVSGETMEDTDSPESFEVTVSHSDDLYDGSYFAAFLTQDKGAGIDHYEYAFSRFFDPSTSSWRRIENPLVLSEDNLSKKVYIKAVDKAGNERISVATLPHYYGWLFKWVIIVMICICILYYTKRFFR
jgi:hypothetical protein